MSSYNNPTRYDLSSDCDGEDGQCTAEMERVSNGDWVSFDEYTDLLAAYEEAMEKLDKIADLTR